MSSDRNAVSASGRSRPASGATFSGRRPRIRVRIRSSTRSRSARPRWCSPVSSSISTAVRVPSRAEERLERGGDVERVRRVALQLAVALDAPDHRCVEADPSVEEEGPTVRPADADPLRRVAVERCGAAGSSRRGRRWDSRASARTRSSNRRGAARVQCSCGGARRPLRSVCRRRRARRRRRSRRSRPHGRDESRGPDRDVSATSTSCRAASSLRIITRLRAVTDDAVAFTSSSTRIGEGTRSLSGVSLAELQHRDRRVPGVPAARRVA